MDLSGEGGSFRLTNLGWSHACHLGVKYGWKPTGTKKPTIPLDTGEMTEQEWNEWNWDGDYSVNEGQYVSAGDARSWADALERALPDIPNHKTRPVEHVTFDDTRVPVIPAVEEGKWTAFDYYSGTNKEGLKAFITFCRGGEFRVL